MRGDVQGCELLSMFCSNQLETDCFGNTTIDLELEDLFATIWDVLMCENGKGQQQPIQAR